MFLKKLLPLVAACLLLAGGAFAAAPLRMSTVWLDEHETFLIWYAKQRGWDKEAGFDLTMMPFDSGSTPCPPKPGTWRAWARSRP